MGIVLGALGCSREGSVSIPSPFLRLADVRAGVLGRLEAPSAAIGETTRYVMAAPRRISGVPVDAQTLARMQEAPIPHAVRCPLGERWQRFVAVLRGYSGSPGDAAARPLVEVAIRGLCPRGEDRSRDVTFPRLPAAVDWARVDLVLLPPRTVASDWIDLPEGAWLETAVGLFGERTPGRARGAEFSVRAVSPGGATAVVALRRTGPFAWNGQDEKGVDPAGGWQPLSLAMDDVRQRLGPRIRLLFTARTKGRSSLVPVWGDPTLFVKRPGNGRRWNVVIVSLDTLRADHLGVYGFPGGVSPHLDRLANEGTMFTDAVTLVNWTLPSHVTMLTGVDPCVHGFRGALSGPGPRRLPPGVVPLAESLRRHGWVTAAFTEDGYVLPVVFRRGFDRFDASKRPQDGVIEDTFGAALTWLRGHAANEFFLFVHTYQVHAPYDPPEPYRSTFAGADASLPKAADAAAYTGEVAFTDAVVGRFLAELDQLGLRDRTIVIVTSDHGESFGEHGPTGHGMSLHEEEVRVPLIWRAPGLIRAGARVDDLTSLVDLVPTVTEMLGVPLPPIVTGRSLYGTMRVGAPRAPLPPNRLLLIEGMVGRSVRADAWKTIFNGPVFDLFDLASDPGERAPKRLAHHAATEALLAEHYALCERLRSQVGVPEEDPGAPIDPALGARLKALGYMH